MNQDSERPLFGIVATFGKPEQLLDAVRASRAAGFLNMDAYTPFPLEGLEEALGIQHQILPYAVLIGAILGALGAYALQYYAAVVDYPVNIGGRPYNSWPVFLMVTFAIGILAGALTAFVGMLMINRLPQFYHPIFDSEAFSLAFEDTFYLCIEALDPHFDPVEVRQHLQQFGPKTVSEVYSQ